MTEEQRAVMRRFTWLELVGETTRGELIVRSSLRENGLRLVTKSGPFSLFKEGR